MSWPLIGAAVFSARVHNVAETRPRIRLDISPDRTSRGPRRPRAPWSTSRHPIGRWRNTRHHTSRSHNGLASRRRQGERNRRCRTDPLRNRLVRIRGCHKDLSCNPKRLPACTREAAGSSRSSVGFSFRLRNAVTHARTWKLQPCAMPCSFATPPRLACADGCDDADIETSSYSTGAMDGDGRRDIKCDAAHTANNFSAAVPCSAYSRPVHLFLFDSFIATR